MGVCDDPISRQAAVDVVHHTIYEFFDVVEDDDESPFTYKDVKLLELNKSISTRIKDLPSAQRWIPVSERLPKDEVDVLVTDDSGGYATIGIDCMYTKEDTGERDWLASQRVTAWMPLPEPYKERSK